MNDSPDPRPVAAAEFEALRASTPLPIWAKGYRVSTSGGRPVLYAEVEGCHVWAQPKAWSTMTVRDDASPGDAAGAPNYGLQLGGMASHAGRLETNDPALGRELLGARAGAEVPLPVDRPAAAAPANFMGAALVLAAGLFLAALILRHKRRRY